MVALYLRQNTAQVAFMVSILRKTGPVGKGMSTPQQQEGQVPTQLDPR